MTGGKNGAEAGELPRQGDRRASGRTVHLRKGAYEADNGSAAGVRRAFLDDGRLRRETGDGVERGAEPGEAKGEGGLQREYGEAVHGCFSMIVSGAASCRHRTVILIFVFDGRADRRASPLCQ